MEACCGPKVEYVWHFRCPRAILICKNQYKMDLGVVLEASWRLEAHGGVLEASWERLASIWRRVFKLQCLARGTC